MNLENKIRSEVGYAVRTAAHLGAMRAKWGDEISEDIDQLIDIETERIVNLTKKESVSVPGPWTRHGHEITGVTVDGPGRPNIARCGGPLICQVCAVDAERARVEALDKS